MVNIKLIIIAAFFLDFQLPPQTITVDFQPSTQMAYVDDPNVGIRRAHGQCHPYTQEIKLNRDHWNKINKYQRWELLYHELGHCILNMDHNREVSIMNPFTKTIYWVKEDGSNWNELVSEMKTRYRSKLKSHLPH